MKSPTSTDLARPIAFLVLVATTAVVVARFIVPIAIVLVLAAVLRITWSRTRGW